MRASGVLFGISSLVLVAHGASDSATAWMAASDASHFAKPYSTVRDTFDFATPYSTARGASNSPKPYSTVRGADGSPTPYGAAGLHATSTAFDTSIPRVAGIYSYPRATDVGNFLRGNCSACAERYPHGVTLSSAQPSTACSGGVCSVVDIAAAATSMPTPVGGAPPAPTYDSSKCYNPFEPRENTPWCLPGGESHPEMCKLDQCMWKHLEPIIITAVSTTWSRSLMPGGMDAATHTGAPHATKVWGAMATTTLPVLISGRPHWGTTAGSDPKPTRFREGFHKIIDHFHHSHHDESDPGCWDKASCWAQCERQVEAPRSSKSLYRLGQVAAVATLLLPLLLLGLCLPCCCRRRKQPVVVKRRDSGLDEPEMSQNDAGAVSPYTLPAAGQRVDSMGGRGTVGRATEEGRSRVRFESGQSAAAGGAASQQSGTDPASGQQVRPTGQSSGAAGGSADPSSQAAGGPAAGGPAAGGATGQAASERIETGPGGASKAVVSGTPAAQGVPEGAASIAAGGEPAGASSGAAPQGGSERIVETVSGGGQQAAASNDPPPPQVVTERIETTPAGGQEAKVVSNDAAAPQPVPHVDGPAETRPGKETLRRRMQARPSISKLQ